MFEIPAGVEFADDLDVSHDPEEYQDPSLPLPVFAGNYGVRIKKSSLKKEFGKDTLVLLKDENGNAKYPVIVINELEVVSPDDYTGPKSVFPGFQEFSTKPGTRTDFNAPGQPKVPFNNLNDIIRSHDASLGYRGLDEGLKLLARIQAEGGIFHVRIDWLAEDRKYIGEQVKLIQTSLEDGELTEEQARLAISNVRYKKGRQEGMAKFVRDGVPVPVWVNPETGDEVEARAIVRGWISTAQLDRFKLGARKVRGVN